MITLLKQLLQKWACKHEWREVAHVAFLTHNRYAFTCKKCGKLKKITL